VTDLYLGIDVGGTSVKLGVCDADGQVRSRRRIATEPARGPGDTVDRIAASARALLAEGDHAPPRACGVGAPGPLDAERRALLRASNLPGWRDVPLPALLAERTGVPTVLENDANCAAWGESRVGVGRGARGLALFTLGTGIGGGLVLDGALWTGAAGAAGAFGHLVVHPDGPLCACGQRGCVEQYASGAAVARASGCASAADAFAAASDGGSNPRARIVVARACDALAAAVAAVIHVLQPDVVALGGGMAAAGDALLEPVRDGVRRRVRPAWLARTRVELGALGDDAGWVGAALWAAHSGPISRDL
jgi:glucokinase